MEKDTKVVDETNVEPTSAESTVEKKAAEAPKEKKNLFLEYLSGIWYNFIDSFKYNHCKLPGILIALPGLFIGFFLVFHSKIQFLGDISQLSGFYMFILVLFGCINIFNGVTVISKKNLGSIIVSAVCSLVIVVFGILWIYSIFHSYYLAHTSIVLENEYVLGVNHFMSIICVALSIICSVTGCILAYFNRDTNYKKVKF